MLMVGERGKRLEVAPLVGAWIEIRVKLIKFIENEVAPLVGAWIEISENSAP